MNIFQTEMEPRYLRHRCWHYEYMSGELKVHYCWKINYNRKKKQTANEDAVHVNQDRIMKCSVWHAEDLKLHLKNEVTDKC